MSRTLRKDKEGNIFWDGRPTSKVNHRCRCDYCTGRDRVAIKEKIADTEIKRAIRGDDFYFGSWYEGMAGEEVLEDYWRKEWEVDDISRDLYREAA